MSLEPGPVDTQPPAWGRARVADCSWFLQRTRIFYNISPPPLSSGGFGFFENFLFHAPAHIPFPSVALPRDRGGEVVPVRAG